MMLMVHFQLMMIDDLMMMMMMYVMIMKLDNFDDKNEMKVENVDMKQYYQMMMEDYLFQDLNVDVDQNWMFDDLELM